MLDQNQLFDALEISMNEYGEVKDKLFSKVKHYDFLKEKTSLEYMTIRRFADMAATVHVMLSGYEVSVIVNESLRNKWGVSVDELFTDALRNMQEQDPIQCLKLNDAFGLAYGSPLYVVTNSSFINGAAMLLCDDFYKTAYEAVGRDFYIIPSSVHEVLVIPKDVAEPCELRKIVNDINGRPDCISKEDILSYNIFETTEAGKLKVVE